ncbi:hypothetical protein NDU88_001745 [Pleurodeles waltl]|uniref:Uncharacterized protein n=1 Tax=Pleurodeles waltl TaxID=8319 RepID=A0AAV7VYI6_PLEWA|nr:hypothetical protein NDU88_001745 [Pleurodeles waltl]
MWPSRRQWWTRAEEALRPAQLIRGHKGVWRPAEPGQRRCWQRRGPRLWWDRVPALRSDTAWIWTEPTWACGPPSSAGPQVRLRRGAWGAQRWGPVTRAGLKCP